MKSLECSLLQILLGALRVTVIKNLNYLEITLKYLMIYTLNLKAPRRDSKISIFSLIFCKNKS